MFALHMWFCMYSPVEEEQKKKLEQELLELRSQITRGSTSEAEDLRRGLDKSERQRAQLSDHIEVAYLYVMLNIGI